MEKKTSGDVKSRTLMCVCCVCLTDDTQLSRYIPQFISVLKVTEQKDTVTCNSPETLTVFKRETEGGERKQTIEHKRKNGEQAL